MTDLDFDELDKAVNSLMGDTTTTKRAPQFDDREEKVVDSPAITPANTTFGQSDIAVDAPISIPPTSIPLPAVAAVAPLAVRRRGQFMDIMHPASPKVTPTVSRQAITIQPRATLISEIEKAEAVALDQPTNDEATALSLERESTGVPEPIEVAARDTSSDGDSIPDVPFEATTAEPHGDAVVLPVSENNEAVGDTRSRKELPVPSFLRGTKVEKRPLGTPPVFSEQPMQPAETLAGATPKLSESSENSLELSAPAVTFSAEPHNDGGDSIALESSMTHDSGQSRAANDTMPFEPTVTVPIEMTPTRPVPVSTVTQQYIEQPSTGSQTNSAMLDTADSRKGLDAPAKKKHSLVIWFLWALVLICIGAAAGAGYFFWSTHS